MPEEIRNGERFLKKSGEGGFTLLEVLLSVTLLTIITLGMFGFFQQAYLYNKMNQSKTVAISLAQNALTYLEKKDGDFIKALEKRYNLEQEITLHFADFDERTMKELGLLQDVFTPLVNNVEYNIVATISPQPHSELNEYMLPITLTIYWQVKEKEYETTVEGYLERDWEPSYEG